MKNSAIDVESSPRWRAALGLFDADLRRRGSAEKTRRAYAFDLEDLATWATHRGIEPTAMTPRDVRRYAASLSEREAAPATVARRLAATRSFFRSLREHGHIAQNPADLVASPKRANNLPAVLKPDELARLLDRIPATTPLEVRDRALFELAYACGLRAEELVKLDVTSLDFDGEHVRVEGKGDKTRLVPGGGAAASGGGPHLARAPPPPLR